MWGIANKQHLQTLAPPLSAPPASQVGLRWTIVEPSTLVAWSPGMDRLDLDVLAESSGSGQSGRLRPSGCDGLAPIAILVGALVCLLLGTVVGHRLLHAIWV